MTGRAYTEAVAGTVAGHYGTYTVRVAYADDGPTTPPETVAGARVTLGALTYDAAGETPLGVGLIGGALETTFSGAGAAGLRAAILASVRAGDVMLTLRGPDGRGGTLTFAGFPDIPDVAQTLSPLLYPDAPLPVVWRDAVALLETEPAADTTEKPIAVASALTRAAEHDAVAVWTGEPVVGGDPVTDASSPRWGSPLEWRFLPPLAEIQYVGLAPGVLGDSGSGSLADQVEAVCRAMTLACYVTLRQHVPTWHLVPRRLLGLALTDATVVVGGTPAVPITPAVTTRTVEGRTVTVEGTWTEDGQIRTRFPPRTFTAVLPDGQVISRDPGFSLGADYWPVAAGVPVYDYDPGGVGSNVQLGGSGIAVEQALPRVAAGTRLGLLTVRAWTDPAPVPGDTETPKGTLRLILTDGTTTYYYTSSGWSTTAGDAEPAALVNDDGSEYIPGRAAGAAGLYPAEALTTDPAPIEGDLTIRLTGEVAGAVWYRQEVYLADAAGDLVTRLSVTLSQTRAAGSPVEIPAPPWAEVTGGTPVEGYYAAAAEATYDSLPTALAAERLAQTALPLDVVEAEVDGLVGPDTRLAFHGGGRYGTPRETVFCGGSLDVRTGLTRGVWCQVRADALAPDPPPDTGYEWRRWRAEDAVYDPEDDNAVSEVPEYYGADHPLVFEPGAGTYNAASSAGGAPSLTVQSTNAIAATTDAQVPPSNATRAVVCLRDLNPGASAEVAYVYDPRSFDGGYKWGVFCQLVYNPTRWLSGVEISNFSYRASDHPRGFMGAPIRALRVSTNGSVSHDGGTGISVSDNSVRQMQGLRLGTPTTLGADIEFCDCVILLGAAPDEAVDAWAAYFLARYRPE